MSWYCNGSKSLLGSIVVLCALIASGCDKNPEIQINSKEGQSVQLFAGENKSISDFKKDLVAHNEYWTHIHAADEYSKKKEFNKAEAEYDLAILASRGHGDVWMARYALKDSYIKSGQFGKALKEIDWLVGNTGRADVIQKLNVEKEYISKSVQRPVDSR